MNEKTSMLTILMFAVLSFATMADAQERLTKFRFVHLEAPFGDG